MKKNDHRGNSILVFLVVSTMILVAVAVFVVSGRKKQQQMPAKTTADEVLEQSPAIENETSAKGLYSGEKIAGGTSQYLAFAKSDYDKAVAEGKIIFLDFYADWCPICRAESPAIEGAFNKLQNENLVGFRVNFNDAQTDEDEKALAKQFSVPYQHYKIIIKNGSVVLKDGETWDAQKAVAELSSL